MCKTLNVQMLNKLCCFFSNLASINYQYLSSGFHLLNLVPIIASSRIAAHTRHFRTPLLPAVAFSLHIAC